MQSLSLSSMCLQRNHGANRFFWSQSNFQGWFRFCSINRMFWDSSLSFYSDCDELGLVGTVQRIGLQCSAMEGIRFQCSPVQCSARNQVPVQCNARNQVAADELAVEGAVAPPANQLPVRPWPDPSRQYFSFFQTVFSDPDGCGKYFVFPWHGADSFPGVDLIPRDHLQHLLVG